jgi:hypothetical protein
MNRRLTRIVFAAALTVIGLGALATTASADIKIRQIHPSNGMFGGDWVELQVAGGGDNTVNGRVIRTFFSGDMQHALYVIPNSPTPNVSDQRTILISNLFTPAGVAADFVAPVSDLRETGQDGAVCFAQNNPPSYTPIDCVAYGNYTGSSLPVGAPAVATPFESTLERGITRGCPTALDPADDTNNSAADFALSTNPPRNNATAPTEKVCPTIPPGGISVCAAKPVTISGTNGADKLAGTAAPDVIAGQGGNDVIKGLAGNDTICGGSGKDKLLGGKGNDKLLGQAGKDTLKGGPGKDKLKGGPGKDVQIQ